MHFFNQAYLLIGGNVGDRTYYLEQAIAHLQDLTGDIINTSPVYETAAWGLTDQPAFLNQALHLQTSLTSNELMQQMLQIEQLLGRERHEKNGPRTIDIDMLLFNDEVSTTPLLTIPHKELENRRFALQPLADIAATVMHPVLKQPVATLLQRCPDPLAVTRYR